MNSIFFPVLGSRMKPCLCGHLSECHQRSSKIGSAQESAFLNHTLGLGLQCCTHFRVKNFRGKAINVLQGDWQEQKFRTEWQTHAEILRLIPIIVTPTLDCSSHCSQDPPVHDSSGGCLISFRRCTFFPLHGSFAASFLVG